MRIELLRPDRRFSFEYLETLARANERRQVIVRDAIKPALEYSVVGIATGFVFESGRLYAHVHGCDEITGKIGTGHDASKPFTVSTCIGKEDKIHEIAVIPNIFIAQDEDEDEEGEGWKRRRY